MRLLILLTGCLWTISYGFIGNEAVREKTKDVKLSPQEAKRVEQMHYGWYVQAISALLGAMGKEMYMKMNRKNRKAFVACLNSIESEHDIKMGAKCLVKAFDNKLLKFFPEAAYSPQYDFVGREMPETKFTPKRLNPKRLKYKEEMTKIAKRRVLKKLIPKIKRQRKTPIRISMGKWGKSKENFRRRFRRNVLSLYANEEAKMEAKRVDKMDADYHPKNMDKMPSLKMQTSQKSPLKAITNLLGGVVRLVKNQTDSEQRTIHSSYKRLTELQNLVSNRNREGQFKHRMLDMVLGKNHPLRQKKTFTERFRDLVPEGMVDKNVYGLVDTVSKHSKDVNYNFLSPRLFPIMPDKYSNKKPVLSPSLFPLYKDDSPNSILSIPEVLEKSGMAEKDRTSLLELVMDAAGVNEVVDDALRIVKGMQSSKIGSDILDISNVIDKTFTELKQSFTKRQNREMATKKYSFLNKEQLNKLYGANGLYNVTITKLPFDIDEFSSMTKREKEESLKNTVRLLADEKPRRTKRTLETRVFRHTTLAPFAFSPTVLVFNVLGPVTLSPNIFSPSILSPLLLSPPIISPQVADPLIFSPYFLGPNVLSAAVFNVYVFSPYVLSPNVINPYVMSPLILSPFVLCPDVLSPTILSGAVLSPSVASPAVFTESALAAAVLSPSIFS